MHSNRRVLLRYALFQIPDLILLSLGVAAAVRWWSLPPLTGYAIVALWIIKDIVLFPLMRIAYDSDGSSADRLAGAQGIAKQALQPTGYVTVGSELWKAKVADGGAPISEGAAVRVVGLQGLTLLVEPVSPDAER